MTKVDISGAIRPPPIPCTTRKVMRLGALQARLDAIEPTRNTSNANIHRRLAPNRRCAQPTNGIVMPKARRYPVLTHWIVATVV